MAGSTFGKRQKEMKRQEKRQEKSARRDQRKQEKEAGIKPHEEEIPLLDGPVSNFDFGDDDQNTGTGY